MSDLKSIRRVVVWFRNELRAADNPLLGRAAAVCRASGAPLVAVFCMDPSCFGESVTTPFGSPKVGRLRRTFVEDSVEDFRTSLKAAGVKLLICDAAPEVALPALAGIGAVVFASSEACPEEADCERRVAIALQSAGASLELLDSGGITTIFGDVELKAAGLELGHSFPEDFKVYYSAVKDRVEGLCRQLPSVDAELSSRCAEVATLQQISEDFLEALPPVVALRRRVDGQAAVVVEKATPGLISAAVGPSILGGETQALARMRAWLNAGGIGRYKATFRHLLGDYASRLSPHLAMGCLSPRRLAVEALRAAAASGNAGSHHIEHFVYELCWRDFFRHAARRWGCSLFKVGGPLGAAVASRSVPASPRMWRRDAEAERRWKDGLTGLPLVDAAMRELKVGVLDSSNQ